MVRPHLLMQRLREHQRVHLTSPEGRAVPCRVLTMDGKRAVVAAVSNAGGFGVLGAVAHTPEQLEIDLHWIEQHTSGRPYGVDLLLPMKYEGADQGGLDREAVRQLLPAEHTAVAVMP